MKRRIAARRQFLPVFWGRFSDRAGCNVQSIGAAVENMALAAAQPWLGRLRIGG